MSIHGERKKKKAKAGHATMKSAEMPMAYDPDRYEKDEYVRALARAHAIKKDPVRHKRAMSHAKTMRAEHAQRRAESDAIVKMADQN